LFAPAFLVLVGKRGTWWVPQWTKRVVPHIDIEGSGSPAAATATAAAEAPRRRPGKDSMNL
jgi:hypothetical protein